MSLRRGFKAEANRLAIRMRRHLGLAPHAPINLRMLASRLGSRVARLSEFADEHGEAVRQLTRRDPSAFSAATIPLPGFRRVIVVNDSHSEGRQNSNVAHEIAHLLLGHEFTLPIDSSGCRNIDRDVEDEANWLGPTLLIPDEAALHILCEEMAETIACSHYGVTTAVLKMRINTSGARIRIARRFH
jgi:hypothetical protein